MPRTLTGSMAWSLSIISLAALLVKVTAKIPPDATWEVCNNQAIRVVNTRVLPDPAPAKIRADSEGSVTARSCSGFRLFSRGVWSYIPQL